MTGSKFDISHLNKAQKKAVEKVDGPLIVIAGPGTGKTQLLSTRAANIVKQTGVGPSNILCLTFTDAAATEMRNRITQIMGPEGGDVAVHTFHSFGSYIISNYPDYFNQERSLRALDDISKATIINSVIDSLPFRHKLRET
jgi:DNA helicase-2/ATP-dependent DNA helicase PcrA